MIFLTDGTRFIGPYDPAMEPFDIARGVRTLREVFGANEVYSVEASDRASARLAFKRSAAPK